MKYKDIEVGKQYRWKRPFGGQLGRVVKTVSTVGVPLIASANWRDHVADGLVTVTKKSRWGVMAQTADGKITAVQPQHLSPPEDDAPASGND
jgi:hypothetical protein